MSLSPFAFLFPCSFSFLTPPPPPPSQLKDKTSRLSLSSAITAALLAPDPPKRISALCELKEEDEKMEDVIGMVEGCTSKVA